MQMGDTSTCFSTSFWGPNDVGVSVLLNRMNDVKSTDEDMLKFYTERANIEDEYAKSLLKLAERPLGRIELGSLKESLDVLAMETRSVAASHASIAAQLRSDLIKTHKVTSESSLARKQKIQSAIEEVFRVKIQQQVEAKKSKERIGMAFAEDDADSKHDLNLRLQRQQSEYLMLIERLSDTTNQWNGEWKKACDAFQVIEEQRIDALKTGLWAFANIFSQTCVTDDESCERLRLKLEKCDAQKDIRCFIDTHGTGSTIPTFAQALGCAQEWDRTRQLNVGGQTSVLTSLDRENLSIVPNTSHDTGSSSMEARDAVKMIHSHPLDGITQLCRSDSSATFASNSTSMAGSYITASSVYSSVPSSQRQTPLLGSAFDSASDPKLKRKKSFIERVDMWPRRSPSPSKLEGGAKPLKAQRTGGSIFDALRPARSRSRASMRNDTTIDVESGRQVDSQSILNVGQNMLPVVSNSGHNPRREELQTDDPIAAALEKLKLDANDSTQDQGRIRDMPASYVTGQSDASQITPKAHHRRFPSRSEASSPILSTSSRLLDQQHPHTQKAQGMASRLGAPPSAHSAAEMRQTADRYIQQNASILAGTYRPDSDRREHDERKSLARSRSRASSVHSARRQAPGDLRRSPSPNPSAYTSSSVSRDSGFHQNMLEQHESSTHDVAVAGLSSTINNPSMRVQSNQTAFSAETNYQANGSYHEASNSPLSPQVTTSSTTAAPHLKEMRHRKSDSQMSRDQSTRDYGQAHLSGQHKAASHRASLASSALQRRSEQSMIRVRSKSFVDAPRQALRYTRDGRQIVAFVLALYDYQATIEEEIGFRQGDTLAIIEMREDGWWLGEFVDDPRTRRGLVPSNFFKKLEHYS